jgi:uncharacterized protein with PIN domain
MITTIVPKFICDDMVGRLCKWLRILGYDTLYFRGTDAELAAISRKEERIVLTRDHELPQQKLLTDCLVLKSDKVLEQVKEVLTAFKLIPIQMDQTFSRCLLCNTLVIQIKKIEIKDRVPEYVYNTHDQFHQCLQCNKIFWTGTHVQNTRVWLRNLLE